MNLTPTTVMVATGLEKPKTQAKLVAVEALARKGLAVGGTLVEEPAVKAKPGAKILTALER